MPPFADQTHKSTARLATWAAVLAAAAAFTVFWLALRPPPMPYRTAAATTCLLCGFAAGIAIIAWIVIKVSNAFATRYTAMEKRVEAYQKEVTEVLSAVTCRQLDILTAVDSASEKVKELEAKVDLHDQQRGGQASRWIDEIGVLSEKVEKIHEDTDALATSVDELREAFIEEGLPGHLGDHHAARF